MSRPLRASERRFVLALSDGATAAVAVTLALWTWSLTAGHTFSSTFVLERWAWFLAVPLWIVALVPTRQANTALDLRVVGGGLLRACGVLFAAYLVAFFFAGQEALPRLMAVYVLWNAAWLTFGSRLLLSWATTRGGFSRRLMIVGAGDAARAAVALTSEPVLADATLVRVVAPEDLDAGHDALHQLATQLCVTDLVVAVHDEAPAPLVDQLLRCQHAGIEVVAFARLYEQALWRVPVLHVGHEWILTELMSSARHREGSPLAKRIFDLVVAMALVALSAPLAVLAAIAIVVETGRPVFYSQVRVGQGGRPFRLVKFRTMVVDAEAAGAKWSVENDPRVTRVGRVLRRMHLDELPNLWSVIRGAMSVVGPRPERPEFVEALEREVPFYRSRLTVPPGITGWAQVRASYGDSVADALTKLEFDLFYIRHRSLWFDVNIIGRTAGRMLGLRGR